MIARVMKKLLAALLTGIAGWTAVADGLPDLTLPNGVGVNIHFTTGHERDLNMIQAGGFKWVRTDLGWDRMERQKGVYDWSDFDKFTDELDKHGLRAYYILDYSNPLYESAVDGENPITHKPESHVTPAPQHAESVAAYARWAAATAEHFRGRGVVWEIWNEPNGTFWEPKADAAQYTALALAAAKAIRAADPHACIVARLRRGSLGIFSTRC
jgi:beta-glucosidase/6-phospho-beta-glucosidase/beta-galactosidase